MRRIGVFLIVMGTLLSSAKAQDIHFSQYYLSPLTLNPAHTGNINGLFRLAANYRTQWYTIQKPANLGTGRTPFETFSGSFDIRLLPNKLDNDRFGVGFVLFNDKAGNGALTTQSIMASIAYHKATDQFGRHQISLGFQGGVVQKKVNLQDLLFEEQLNDLFFDPTLPSGEEARFDGPVLYPDFNLGALWQSTPVDNFSYYLGFAWNHVAKPNESFFVDQVSELDHRYVAHVGMEFRLGDYSSLSPSALYMLQANAQQWSVGLAFRQELNENSAAFIGAWTRIKDAAILTLGYEYKDIRFGASYDITYSDLSAPASAQGALELAVVYIHNNRKDRVHFERYCPNF